MQYSTFLLSALSAVGALAIPTGSRSNDTSVRITLAGASELATQTAFQKVQFGQREVQAPVGSSGPFQTVELSLGKGVQMQNLRCQILDEEDKPIVLLRDLNVDITFADADKGAWKFRQESVVSAIICDPTFAAIGADANDIVVMLSGPDELATQTPFLLGGAKREVQPPVASSGPYDTIELKVGALIENQDLRCQLLDARGNSIVAKRNQNIDTTFSDAGKGAWTFLDPVESEVFAIVCDPAFKAAPAA
ncbi:uncharacterized protein K441DRAFT_651684 [Cenococcum geophilum 1.58]|uniref:uncharacterized protein n=1 Tax=Cenococcum geophilum 1.58 TaxID=794803 RepID=UPI00358E0B6C|nr:hypothetical protein K441DRAFT_651684 [Cenococcum geophilum 1.58]